MWGQQVEYPKQLAEALTQLPRIPLKIHINGEKGPLWVDNIPICTPAVGDRREKTVPLAHALLALEKNAKSLAGGRPTAETNFITNAIHYFSRIMITTEIIHRELIGLMARQGITNAEAILKEKKLGFEAKRADEMLTKHAPFLKLAAVIAPLTGAYFDEKNINELLGLIHQKVEEVPPIVNAEHGARLLEAMLHYLTDYAPDKKGLDVSAIKSYLRKSVHDQPFNVAALKEHDGVQEMLRLATEEAKQAPALRRALNTWNRALVSQHETAEKEHGVNAATRRKPPCMSRILRRKRRSGRTDKEYSGRYECGCYGNDVSRYSIRFYG